MSDLTIRAALPADRQVIRVLVERAFGQPLEAVLVDFLVDDGDAVLELVAERQGEIVGHILFSRLMIEVGPEAFPAVALAPIGIDPDLQRQGIGGALITEAHNRLREAGERLSVVLGDPAYYSRFGYQRGPAQGFASDYQCEALQALAWGEAPATGRLVYARAFGNL